MLRAVILTAFFLEVLFTGIDLFVTEIVDASGDGSSSGSVGTLQAITESAFLDVLQIILCSIVIYLLLVYGGWQRKIVLRDDPFPNAALLSFLLFCIVIQKYIIIYIFDALDGDSPTPPNPDVIQIVIKTLMSLQVLFTIIPFRHNFSLDHVETE